MGWRYQPVWVERDGEKVFSLCEVYFDKSGRLESWTESPAITPQGSGDVQELRNDITNMLADSYKWRPVEFSKMKVGMTFGRAISQEQMDGIADMVDAISDASKAAAREVNLGAPHGRIGRRQASIGCESGSSRPQERHQRPHCGVSRTRR